MTDADHPENRRTATRHLATFRVRLGYADMDAFLSGYAVNISKGGIYVPTKQPKPRGTEIRFEILLKDGAVAVSGAGRVAWSAPFDPADPTKRYGMGVQFSSIDAASDDVVRKALEWKAAHLPAREASREVCPEDSKDQAAAHPVPGPEPAPPAPPPPKKPAGADPVTRTIRAAGKKASLSDVDDLLASLRGTTAPRTQPAQAKPRPAAPAAAPAPKPDHAAGGAPAVASPGVLPSQHELDSLLDGLGGTVRDHAASAAARSGPEPIEVDYGPADASRLAPASVRPDAAEPAPEVPAESVAPIGDVLPVVPVAPGPPAAPDLPGWDDEQPAPVMSPARTGPDSGIPELGPVIDLEDEDFDLDKLLEERLRGQAPAGGVDTAGALDNGLFAAESEQAPEAPCADGGLDVLSPIRDERGDDLGEFGASDIDGFGGAAHRDADIPTEIIRPAGAQRPSLADLPPPPDIAAPIPAGAASTGEKRGGLLKKLFGKKR